MWSFVIWFFEGYSELLTLWASLLVLYFPGFKDLDYHGFFREGLQCNYHDVNAKLSSIKGTIN